MMRQLSSVVAAVAILAACSGSDSPESPDTTTIPGLDRIDGPAVVDPSYDPMRVDPSVPAVTEVAG